MKYYCAESRLEIRSGMQSLGPQNISQLTILSEKSKDTWRLEHITICAAHERVEVMVMHSCA